MDSEDFNPERAREILKKSLSVIQREFDDTIRELIRIRTERNNEQAK